MDAAIKKVKCIIYGGGLYEAQIEDYINFDYVCVVAISDGNKALWGKKRKLPLNEIRDVTVVAPILSLWSHPTMVKYMVSCGNWTFRQTK